MKGAIEVLKSVRDMCVNCPTCPLFDRDYIETSICMFTQFPDSWTDEWILRVVKIAGKEVKKE